MAKAVILDRDGVINKLINRGTEDAPRWTSPWTLKEFEFIDGAKEVIRDLKRRGYTVFVATNQPGIANGEFDESVLDDIHDLLYDCGVDNIRVCPHNDADNCECRKPKPAMLNFILEDWDLDAAHVFFVGDSKTDLEAAEAAHCQGVLLRTPLNGDVLAAREIATLHDLLLMLP